VDSTRSDALVLFGSTGDLARKKIYPALLAMAGRGRLDVPVIGVARGAFDAQGFRDYVHKSLGPSEASESDFAKLAPLLDYVQGDYRDAATYDALRRKLGNRNRPLHYLAIPPDAFPTVIDALGRSGCTEGARVVLEKPFGRDLASARSLNATLHARFPEEAIFRIDHYLGKEPILNLAYFRFANSFLEPVWNRHYVSHVEVTQAEAFGIEGRGEFYESVGAIRDVVQNHLLQVTAILAMEPPNALSGDAQRDEKVKVLRAMRPLEPRDIVRGQYHGYRSERGVDPASTVETFAAVRLHIDSWRWAGVPFFIRAGKRLPVTATEIVVEFRRPPQDLFAEPTPPHANYARFQLGPERVAIAMGVRTKVPGTAMTGKDVELYCCNERGPGPDPYERLIGDALAGDGLLFARQDAVEAAWSVVEAALESTQPPLEYAPGTWGPDPAAAMTASMGGWHAPAVRAA
jgi:glucose-6-phosphate 1-dehydrogenase